MGIENWRSKRRFWCERELCDHLWSVQDKGCRSGCVSLYGFRLWMYALAELQVSRLLLLVQKMMPPVSFIKGGESSSQFPWFTIAKIELYFLIFFALISGLLLQRYSTNTKRYPPKKVFGNFEFCSSHQNHSRPNSLEDCGSGGKKKNQSFQKLFVGGYLFVFVEYFCNGSSKIRTNNIKNYGLILATVNHWNWLDDSPPLK